MTWYAFVGVLACISKTSFMKQFFVFFHQCTLIFSMLFQLKKKKKLCCCKSLNWFTSCSWFSQPAVWKKKSWSWFITVFWEVTHCDLLPRGLQENMRFPAALWPSGTESNYTFPLNTPKLSEFQRKYLPFPSQDSVVLEMANLWGPT